jgi:hypothetical protein
MYRINILDCPLQYTGQMRRPFQQRYAGDIQATGTAKSYLHMHNTFQTHRNLDNTMTVILQATKTGML